MTPTKFLLGQIIVVFAAAIGGPVVRDRVGGLASRLSTKAWASVVRPVQKRTDESIRNFLGSMYRYDLVEGRLKTLYRGEEIVPPEELDFGTDPVGRLMKSRDSQRPHSLAQSLCLQTRRYRSLYRPHMICATVLEPKVELPMIPDTASHPSSLGAMMVRGALMAVLTAVSWTVLFIFMGVSAFSAILAVVIAGGFRFLCFGLPIRKHN